MVYDGFMNQTTHIFKFFAAFLFLFFILPGMLGKRFEEDDADYIVAQYIRTVFLVIVSGYVLSVIKIFEFLTMFTIILFFVSRKIKEEAKILGKKSSEDIGLVILRMLEKQINLLKSISQKTKHIIFDYATTDKLSRVRLEKIVFLILVLIVLLLSAYIRFYDAITHAAFPLSDSYITLDWLKGVERRQLFYEPGGGVYPRGLSIFMATIRKFSFIDAIYILKYTGPLNGLLIVVSIFFVVDKLTRSKYAALGASALYGIGAELLGSEFVRQAATNSQEFALVFFLPTVYFTYKYFKDRRKQDMITAIMGLTVMGLVHTFVYLFGVIAVGMNILILFMKGPVKNFKYYMLLIAGGFFSAVVAVIPFVVGLLEGIGLHGSSVEFLTDTGNMVLKKLSVLDYGSLIILLLLGIYLVIIMRKNKLQANSLLPVFLTMISIFVIYFAGGYLTKSTLLDTRTKEIWSVCAALSVGVGIGTLISRIETRTAGKFVCFTAFIACFGMIIHFSGMKPLDPYKMEWDSGVEQYLNISEQYRPKTWTMVAEELQYAMVEGTGFLITTENFISNYSTNDLFNDDWLNIGEHIFIYQQKNIFEVSKRNSIYIVEEPIYEKEKIHREAVEKWLALYEASGGTYEVYYEDENLRIIYIYNKAYEGLEKKKLWGGQS